MNLSLVLIALMKGIITRETIRTVWQSLLDLQARVRDYVGALGLELVLDETEGYAYLRQRPAAPTTSRSCRGWWRAGHSAIPSACCWRCCARGWPNSTPPAARRGWSSAPRRLPTWSRLFLPDAGNEAQVGGPHRDATSRKIEDLGFLRQLRGSDDRLEVRRILKSFVDAQWLGEFERGWPNTARKLVTSETGLSFHRAPRGARAPGFRLVRFEVLNWGTFHRRVWGLEHSGNNALLTGDIGSGKSTLVDALTTLLVPRGQIAYNKAAGADGARALPARPTFFGVYKAERGEPGLAAKQVALRDHD